MVICSNCQSSNASEYKYIDGTWTCRHCTVPREPSIYFKEMGVENPGDPKGSTAHVRDIKARRLDTKTGKMFYYQAPKTYFFPKG